MSKSPAGIFERSWSCSVIFPVLRNSTIFLALFSPMPSTAAIDLAGLSGFFLATVAMSTVRSRRVRATRLWAFTLKGFSPSSWSAEAMISKISARGALLFVVVLLFDLVVGMIVKRMRVEGIGSG